MALDHRNYFIPIAGSVLLHAVLLAVVLMGWQVSSDARTAPPPRYIPATLVQMEARTVAPPAAEKPKPKVVDLQEKKREQERLKAAEEEKRRVAQRKEREKKAQEEKEKREQAEREKKAREERERKEAERRAREAEVAAAMAAEQATLQAQQDEQTAQSFVALIKQRIENNWSRPPSARNGMQCTLSLQLVPTGRIVGVTVVKSSGNSAFDRSAEQAVWKAEQFTELREVPSTVFERYFRSVTINFNPQDLRL